MQKPPATTYFTYALILTLLGSVFSAVIPVFQTSYASHQNINFTIDNDIDEAYEEGDSVVIEGTIDDVDPDVDSVDITIRDEPQGSTVEDDTSDLGSSDNFDMVFDVGGGDDDGVYEVEVEYDTDSAFSYFIIDNDDDLVRVILGETVYSAGDEVEISGDVDDVVTGEDQVEITVFDPNNDDIVSQETADLGDGTLDDDEFAYSFDLDDNADHGRYAVIVSYDNEDQQGFAMFEIEDDDDGGGSSSDGDSDSDGDLTAEISEATYEPGDTVTISGNIDNYDTDNELGITIEDPDGDEVDSDDDVSVESNGDFEFDLDLEDDAAEGDYDVTLTYDTDEVGLTFEVEDTGTGGGTGGSTTTVTAKLNKSSYLAGDLVTVTGTVPKIVEDEVVSVMLYRPDGTVVLSASKYAEPESDKTYSVQLRLDSDLEVEDEYSIKVAYDNKEVEIEFDITGQSTTGGALTVKTDKTTYENGSTVKVTGTVASDLIVPNQDQVLLRFNAPDKNPCRIDPADLASDGSYSYSLVLGGKCGLTGQYEVVAFYNQKDVKTTFSLQGGGITAYTLQAGGKSHTIEYEITQGQIKSMFVKPAEKILVVSIDADQDGQLTLVLPREVIDAIQGSQDIPFVVTTTDTDSGTEGNVEIDESDTTATKRTIAIDYDGGTDLIEITGTQIVPEFTSIAVIVIAAGILGTIVIVSRNSNKLGLFKV
jgi:hypothetical protein